MSDDRYTYIEYTRGISPRAAGFVLVGLLCTFICAELFLRITPPPYARTAGCSLHGFRTLFELALRDNRPKIIAVGDSALVGAGIFKDEETFLGRMNDEIGNKIKIYNLAVPGGNTTSSLMILDALEQENVKNVDRVLIEVLPGKFIAKAPGQTYSLELQQQVFDELQRFLPMIRPDYWKLPHKSMSMQQRLETYLEYQFGMASAVYLNRDWLRTQYLGNYPAFWVLGNIIPQGVRDRLFGAKGAGTNRLAARMNDHPFVGYIRTEEDSSVVPTFNPHYEGDSLKQAIAIARRIGKKEPIIVVFPMHYEYNRLTSAQKVAYILAMKQLYDYISELGRTDKCQVMIVRSEDFQQAEYWTRTPAHFNVLGSSRVWESLKDGINKLYKR